MKSPQRLRGRTDDLKHHQDGWLCLCCDRKLEVKSFARNDGIIDKAPKTYLLLTFVDKKHHEDGQRVDERLQMTGGFICNLRDITIKSKERIGFVVVAFSLKI